MEPAVSSVSVATREGGVDRNVIHAKYMAGRGAVATREGGVDRNLEDWEKEQYDPWSPPARVAWIETAGRLCCQTA